MNPLEIITWTCVGIFILTAILTLLHVSGIRPLPNEGHGKTLFRILIVEVAVIAVVAFGDTLSPPSLPPANAGMQGPSTVQNKVNTDQDPKTNWTRLPPSTPKSAIDTVKNQGKIPDGCSTITVMDASTFPPSSKIELICP